MLLKSHGSNLFKCCLHDILFRRSRMMQERARLLQEGENPSGEHGLESKPRPKTKVNPTRRRDSSRPQSLWVIQPNGTLLNILPFRVASDTTASTVGNALMIPPALGSTQIGTRRRPCAVCASRVHPTRKGASERKIFSFLNHPVYLSRDTRWGSGETRKYQDQQRYKDPTFDDLCGVRPIWMLESSDIGAVGCGDGTVDGVDLSCLCIGRRTTTPAEC